MCSRFELSATPGDLARRFRFDQAPPFPNTAEIRPTNQALVIANDGAGRVAALLGWGLRVEWSTTPVINARAETLAEKRTFRLLLARRCLVPATAYFEWRKHGKTRVKNRIRPDGESVFAFAGLTDGEHFTIATCPPVPAIAHIHDRMPVILAPEAEAAWIEPTVAFTDVAGLLVPFAVETLTAIEEEPAEEPQPDLFS